MSTAATAGNCLDILRKAIESLSDEQIHHLIDSVVGGFVCGMIDDIHARKDDIVAEVVGNILGHISAAAQQAQLRDVAVAAAKIGAPSANIDAALTGLTSSAISHRKPGSRHAQDAVERVCEVCGREGTRRYVQTASGWRCSRSSAAQCARRAAARSSVPVVDPRFTQRSGRGLPGMSDIAKKHIPLKVTPAAPAAATGALRTLGDYTGPVAAERTDEPGTASEREGVDATATAHCQDCNRAWTLTGMSLRRAVEAHELQKGHIVNVFDSVEGGAA